MTVFDAAIEGAPGAWAWTVRDKDLVEFDGPIDGYMSCHVVVQDGQPGRFDITLHLDRWAVPLLLTEGYGVVIRLPGQGDVIASGTVNQQATTYQRSSDGGNQVTVTGALDESILASEVAWAEPGKWLNDATSRNVVSGAVDARSGHAEAVLLGFVEANMGASAYHSTGVIDRRRNGKFTIPASSGRGTSGDYQAQFGTQLLDIAAAICRTSGITWRVLQAASGHIAMSIRARADKSADVVFSQAEGSLASAVFTRVKPTITQGIAVSDDGSTRSYVVETDVAAETLWGERRVATTDGDSNVIADLTQAAADLIATGIEQAGASLEPVILPGAVQFGIDYQLGDSVTVVDASGDSIVDRLVQVDYAHEAGAAPTLTPSVGISQEDMDSALVPLLRQITAAIREQKRRPR